MEGKVSFRQLRPCRHAAIWILKNFFLSLNLLKWDWITLAARPVAGQIYNKALEKQSYRMKYWNLQLLKHCWRACF